MRKPDSSQNPCLKPYKTGDSLTYAGGAYAAIELLKTRPDLARKVYIHPSFLDKEALYVLCRQANVPFTVDAAAFARVNQKENSYVLATLAVTSGTLSGEKPHVVLVNPADMGNLGTILRTMAGLGLSELALIGPCADVWHPKTIRASMGAIFHQSCALFPSFAAYRRQFPAHECFAFMLSGRPLPAVVGQAENPLYALVFGNEATGLDASFAALGTPVRIPQTAAVDSLNLAAAAAVAVGAYGFALHFAPDE